LLTRIHGGAEALLRQKTQQLKDDLKQIEAQATNRLQAEAIKVAQELEDATEEAETWGNTIGTGERTPPGQKLEKLARMVGRMKLSALAIRKKVFERSSEELLEVEQGDALHRRDNECINYRDLNIASPNWMAWKYRN